MSQDNSLTFTDLVDFLADNQGKEVYVEFGTRYPGREVERVDAFVLKLHGTKLGAIQDATEYDSDKTKAVMIRLHPRDAEVGENEKKEAASRLFFNRDQITAIEGNKAHGVKVWVEDTFYVGVNRALG